MSDIAKGWSITEVFEKAYVADRIARTERITYYATLVGDTHNQFLKKYGQMTREEAMAMAKLLNASQTD